MKALLFIGGYKPDKTIFAIVSLEPSGTRAVHIYKSDSEVCNYINR